MAVNRAALVETLDKQRNEQSFVANKSLSLRLAHPEQDPGSRLRRLVDLASAVVTEAQVLACDKTFADESARIQNLDIAKGIDFYTEVQRFEAALIKLALEQSGGNQAKAARLLGLRATTLNSKIKLLFD